jgi:hypothetical protein
MMQITPAKIAQPEPLSKVVLLFKKKTIAVSMRAIIDSTVTNQIIILGKNKVKIITIKLKPNEINTPQSKKSIAL